MHTARRRRARIRKRATICGSLGCGLRGGERRHSEWIDTNWAYRNGDNVDDYPGSMLDFVFVAKGATEWNAICRVIVREGVLVHRVSAPTTEGPLADKIGHQEMSRRTSKPRHVCNTSSAPRAHPCWFLSAVALRSGGSSSTGASQPTAPRWPSARAKTLYGEAR